MCRLCLVTALLLLLIDATIVARGQAEDGASYEDPVAVAQSTCEGELPPADLMELFDSAFLLGKKGHFDSSVACFERYIGLVPEDIKGWQLWAEIQSRLGDHHLAMRGALVAARIPGDEPEAAEGYFLLANAHLAQHMYGVARQHYYRAMRVNPLHVNSMINLGVVLGNANDFTEAIPVYRRALELDPTIMAARHNLASALHTIKRLQEAVEVLEALRVGIETIPNLLICMLAVSSCACVFPQEKGVLCTDGCFLVRARARTRATLDTSTLHF